MAAGRDPNVDPRTNEYYLNTETEGEEPLTPEVSRGNAEQEGQPLMPSDMAGRRIGEIISQLIAFAREVLGDLEGEEQ